MSKFVEITPSSTKHASLKAILKKMRGRKALVIGDVGIDRYTIGAVERISPEAPVPIVRVEQEVLKLGLAANVADNVRALGATPFLVGVVGEDRGGEDFGKLLKKTGITGSHLVRDPSRPTILKERVVSDRQQIVRIDYESGEPLSGTKRSAVMAKIRSLVDRVDVVILEDYAKGLLNQEMAEEIFSACKKSGRSVAVDPNTKSPLVFYRGATVLTPNTKEAEALSGIKIHDQDSLSEAGFKILKVAGARHAVITRGKDGMAIFSQGSKTVRLIGTFAREVFDVSGAGDTVISVLSLALSAGASIEDAVVLGNLAAGIEVGKRGTATVTESEILAELDHWYS